MGGPLGVLSLAHDDPPPSRIISSVYPDRLGKLYAGPVNFAVRGIFGMIKPLMAKRLTDKIVLMSDSTAELVALLGSEHVPDFFGGTAVHDVLSDEGGFDFAKMDRRQQELLELQRV